MQRDPLVGQSLAVQYREACRQTDRLFSLVRPSFLTSRPVPERHRLLFYIGHLEAFDWNLLSQRLLHQTPFSAAFDRLFAFGIDPVGGGLPTDTPDDWPLLREIYAYRDEVRRRIEGAIPDVDFSRSAVSARPSTGAHAAADGLEAAADSPDADAQTLLQVAIEHRQMHAETLAYLIHQMPLAHKRRPDDVASAVAHAAALTPARADDAGGDNMVTVPAGDVTLGMPAEPTEHRPTAHEPRPFGWDNEFGEQTVSLPAFQIDEYMVSNGDFLRFIAAGGYDDRRFWREEDWAWRIAAGIDHPAFWERDGDRWWQRTMFDRLPLPLDWPVYVSHAEANAYASYVGKRLPTEAEWLRAATGAAALDAPPEEGNFDFRHWDPVAVDAYPRNRSVFGVKGQFGNGWEWTADRFAPFPGFKAFSFYRGYSADFFDDKHYVMKGGSPRTAARMLRPSFRNWFQPHYPYVYAGLRCVQTAQGRPSFS